MTNTSFKIKKYINEVGFYCSIELDTRTDGSSLEINFSELVDDLQWNSSIEFGIKYFYEHYTKNKYTGLSVLVKNIHTMIGDTSHIIVAYATIKCLCTALQYPDELIKFDEANGSFVFTK